MSKYLPIFDILACPLCKGKLSYDRAQQELICRFDKLAYPVKNNEVVMLVAQARNVESQMPTSHYNGHSVHGISWPRKHE